jgi:hypothetical protein
MGEFAAAKTSVWWDIENCCVPRSCDPQLIVQNMSSALAAAGYRGPISVSAYGDTNGISLHALSSTGVSLNHVPAGTEPPILTENSALVPNLIDSSAVYLSPVRTGWRCFGCLLDCGAIWFRHMLPCDYD